MKLPNFKSKTKKSIFPYAQKTFNDQLLYDPTINLSVQTANYSYLNIRFLVDTGADITLLPINPYAALFDAHLDPEKTIKIKGIARTINAYPHTLQLKIDKQIYPIRCYLAPIKTIPLLGRLDLWDQFTFTFNNQKHCTELITLS